MPEAFDSKVFLTAARKVYKDKGFTAEQLVQPEMRGVIEETARVLSAAVSSALPHEVKDTLRYALEENAFIFSGFKTYHSLREVGLSLFAEDGSIKPFNQFWEDVKRINNTYNENYLRAEYQQAVGASMMATKWAEFAEDGDRYDLQYRTAGDERVRASHAALSDITLPPSDPFWSSYFPPNGWGCRCDVVQIRKGKYERTDSAAAQQLGEECTATPKLAMFRFNPGQAMELFPPKHPYYKGNSEAVSAALQKVANQIDGLDVPDPYVERGTNMPKGFNTQQQARWNKNMVALENKLGKPQNTPMTFEQANDKKGNPNFLKKSGFDTNCQSCVVAHELRRRGFDVEARPRVEGSGSLTDQLAHRTTMIWRDPATGQEPMMKLAGGKHKTLEQLYKEFSALTKETGRYNLLIEQRGGTRHIISFDRGDSRRKRVYDPQTGETLTLSALMQRINHESGIAVLRVDNLLVNTDIVDGIVKAKPTL